MEKTFPGRSLTEGVIWKQLLLFAVPILLSNLLQQFYNTADAIIVGVFLGSKAIAAVGSTGSLINMLISLFLGLGAGASVVTARYFGAEDGENMHKTVHTAIFLSLVSGFVLMVLGFSLSPFFLKLMSTPDDVFSMSDSYLRIYFLGVIPMLIYNNGAGILRAIGDSKRPLHYLLISGIANIVLDIIFVAAFNMGVAGAAWATLIAQSISTVLVLKDLIKAEGPYKLTLSKIRFYKQQLWLIIKIGIPAGFQSMLYSISNMLLQSNINTFGSTAMAGCAAYGKIDGLMYIPSSSIGLACMTFTSQNIGAKKLDRVYKCYKYALAMGMFATLLTSLFVITFSDNLLAVLTKNDAEAIEYGISMMWLLCPFCFIHSVTEVTSGTIRGAGSTFIPMLLTAFSICVFRIIWVTVMMPIYGDIRIVFLSYPLSWALCALSFFIYYVSGKWKPKAINTKNL